MDAKECFDCHQLGNKATREILPAMSAGTASTLEAWEKRTKVGPSGPVDGQLLHELRRRIARRSPT